MTAKRIDAIATADGLSINGHIFNKKLLLQRYQKVLGEPSRTITAGAPAPAGHRSNLVHLFDSDGIYLTEHHASRLIESVNFVFVPSECLFSIGEAFHGSLVVDGQRFRFNMTEGEIDLARYARDLPGEYSLKYKNCWIGISTRPRRDSRGKQSKRQNIIEVSVCLSSEV